MKKKTLLCILSLALCLMLTACGGDSNVENILVSTDEGSATIGISEDKGYDVSDVDLNYMVESITGHYSFVYDDGYEIADSLGNEDYGRLYHTYNPQFRIECDESDSVYSMNFETSDFKLEDSGLGTNTDYDSSIGATETEEYDGVNYRDWFVFFDSKGKMITDYHNVDVNKKLIDKSGGFVYAFQREDSDEDDDEPYYSVYLYTTDKAAMKNWIKNLGIPDEDIDL